MTDDTSSIFYILMQVAGVRYAEECWHDAEVLYRIAARNAQTVEDRERAYKKSKDAGDNQTARERPVKEAKESDTHKFYMDMLKEREAFLMGQIALLKEMVNWPDTK